MWCADITPACVSKGMIASYIPQPSSYNIAATKCSSESNPVLLPSLISACVYVYTARQLLTTKFTPRLEAKKVPYQAEIVRFATDNDSIGENIDQYLHGRGAKGNGPCADMLHSMHLAWNTEQVVS